MIKKTHIITLLRFNLIVIKFDFSLVTLSQMKFNCQHVYILVSCKLNLEIQADDHIRWLKNPEMRWQQQYYIHRWVGHAIRIKESRVPICLLFRELAWGKRHRGRPEENAAKISIKQNECMPEIAHVGKL